MGFCCYVWNTTWFNIEFLLASVTFKFHFVYFSRKKDSESDPKNISPHNPKIKKVDIKIIA